MATIPAPKEPRKSTEGQQESIGVDWEKGSAKNFLNIGRNKDHIGLSQFSSSDDAELKILVKLASEIDRITAEDGRHGPAIGMSAETQFMKTLTLAYRHCKGVS
jgi:hypothetical protein